MIKLSDDLVAYREESSQSVKDLSDKLEETKLSVNGELESVKITVHQQGLEMPRKLNQLSSELELHSGDVSLTNLIFERNLDFEFV